LIPQWGLFRIAAFDDRTTTAIIQYKRVAAEGQRDAGKPAESEKRRTSRNQSAEDAATGKNQEQTARIGARQLDAEVARLQKLQAEARSNEHELDQAKLAVLLRAAEVKGDAAEVARIRLRQAESEVAMLTKLHAEKVISDWELNDGKLKVALRAAELKGDDSEEARILAQQQAATDEAKRELLRQAEAELARLTKLHAQKIVSDQEITEAKLLVDLRAAELKGDPNALAEWRVRQAEHNLEVAAKLYEAKAASQESLDEAKSNLELRRAELKRAKDTAAPASDDRPVIGAGAKNRVVNFPHDRSLGALFIRNARGTWSFNNYLDEWVEFGEAEGKVAVPAGKELRLDVSEKGATDLSPLARLAPDDLRAIQFLRSDPDDAALKHVGRLTGLKTLRVDSPNVGDEGIAWCAGLRELVYLNAGGTKITDKSLKVIGRLGSLQGLHLDYTAVSDRGLVELSGITSIQYLGLNRTGVTDAGIAHLGDLRELRLVRLSETAVTDKALEYFSKLPNLEELDLDSTAVTDHGMATLKKLPRLRRLTISRTDITDAGLAEVSGFKSLEALTLPKHITDKGIGHFTGLASLRELNLDDTEATGKCLESLKDLPSLKTLSLAGKVKDDDLANLKNFPELAELRIQNAPITDKGMRILATLKSLKNLSLDTVQATDAGYAALKELPALEFLYLRDQGEPRHYESGIGDDGLAHIAMIPTLKHLDLSRSRVTDKGLRQLKRLPALEVLTLGDCRVNGEGLAELRQIRTLKNIYLSNTEISSPGVDALISLPSLDFLSLQRITIAPNDLLRLQASIISSKLSISLASQSTPAPFKIGDAAPDFKVQTLDGKTFQLAEQRGKTVLLYFWAMWCSPCIASTPELKQLEEELRRANPDFVMLSLSMDEVDTRVRQHVAKHGLKWSQAVIGRNSKVAADYRVIGAPMYIAIGPDGTIVSTSKDWNAIRAASAKPVQLLKEEAINRTTSKAKSPSVELAADGDTVARLRLQQAEPRLEGAAQQRSDSSGNPPGSYVINPLTGSTGLASPTEEVARLRLQQAEAKLKGAAQLYRDKNGSKEALDDAKFEVEIAKAELDGNQVAVRETRLRHAEARLEGAQRLFSARVGSKEKLDEAKFGVEIAKAELGGNPVAVAEARLRKAEAHLSLVAKLHAAKGTSDEKLDDAKFEVEIARAELKRAKAAVASNERPPGAAHLPGSDANPAASTTSAPELRGRRANVVIDPQTGAVVPPDFSKPNEGNAPGPGALGATRAVVEEWLGHIAAKRTDLMWALTTREHGGLSLEVSEAWAFKTIRPKYVLGNDTAAMVVSSRYQDNAGRPRVLLCTLVKRDGRWLIHEHLHGTPQDLALRVAGFAAYPGVRYDVRPEDIVGQWKTVFFGGGSSFHTFKPDGSGETHEVKGGHAGETTPFRWEVQGDLFRRHSATEVYDGTIIQLDDDQFVVRHRDGQVGYQRVAEAAGAAPGASATPASASGFIGFAFGAGDFREITSVVEGSPAAAAGLERGDYVIEVDGKPAAEIKELKKFKAALRGRAGTDVRLSVRKARTDAAVTLALRRAEFDSTEQTANINP
jgi:peroxiredoxin/Leucine-rich repeat (LRR) protein